MLFRPAESSKNIVDFYRNYLLTTFQTNNDVYNTQLKEHLHSEGVISSGPFLSLTDSFSRELSMRDLADGGILSRKLLELVELKPDRKLYKHQVEAIRKANENKNLIITTGTGSGKTECFLIPVLNQLMREKADGTLDKGVRNLIIYPMNALVNDQIRRLREIFDAGAEDAPFITFGKFTGETKERFEEARSLYLEREKREPCKNEIIFRQQMRDNPPNILITNYAMLEYLLLRPGDNIFFSTENAHKWHSIVFDEAHTYNGAKGIEVATLIKRVNAMLRRNDLQYLLTSATLGDENANPKVVSFAESLCNARFDSDSIIRAYTTAPQASEDIRKLDMDTYRKLALMIRDNAAPTLVAKCLRENGIGIKGDGASEHGLEEAIYNMVLHDAFYHRIRKQLLNQTKSLNQLAAELNVNVNDLSDFVTVASNAQMNGDKLFDARYHMFMRGLEGVFVTLKPSNRLFVAKRETFKENPFDDYDCGYKVFEISFCHNCNATFITGQTQDGILVQRSKFSDDFEPEVYLLDGDYDEDDDIEDADKSYYVCSKCGAIKRTTAVNGLDCGHGKENYNRLVKVKEKGSKLHSCPCCHTINTQRSIIRPYFLGNEAATAVIATALYNELPNVKVTNKTIELKDEFFGSKSECAIEERQDCIRRSR